MNLHPFDPLEANVQQLKTMWSTNTGEVGGGCACLLDYFFSSPILLFPHVLFPSHVLNECDLKGKTQSIAWKPFVGGDGNSLKGKNHFFRRNSDVCLCVHTCIRAYVHIDILVLKWDRKKRGWEFLRELSRDFPTFSNLKEKALYKWQSGVLQWF